MHGGVRTSSSVSQSSSLWLECAGFTGGSAATSCDDMMRAALILIGPHLHTPRPAAAAACCALRCLSTTLCLMRAMIATRTVHGARCHTYFGKSRARCELGHTD